MENQEQNNSSSMFATGNIKALVVKMGTPAFIMMLMFGLYSFVDSILSVNFAPSSYANDATFQDMLASGELGDAKDIVRLMMASTNSVINMLNSVSILFAMGIGTRHAINMGKGDEARAKNNIRVGVFYGLIVSAIMILVLYLINESWIGSQLPGGKSNPVVKYSASYTNVLIAAMPLLLFNNIFTFVLRNEGKNVAISIASIAPIAVNLFLDWLFMEVMGMGIEGGAWATFVSYVATFILLIAFAYFQKSRHVRLSVMFGLKMDHIGIVGIVLAGAPAFMGNFGFSISQTLSNNVAIDISQAVYGNAYQLLLLSSAVWPIFMLAFPAVMGLSQGATPIASYNYGAKNIDRVRETAKWTFIFTLVLALFTYGVINLMAPVLFNMLGVQDALKDSGRIALAISTLALIPFAFSVAAMVYFASIDRIIQNLIANMSFSVISYIPVLFIIRAIAIASPGFEYTYWFIWISTALVEVVMLGAIMYFTNRTLDQRTGTLDELILKIEHWIRSKFSRSKA